MQDGVAPVTWLFVNVRVASANATQLPTKKKPTTKSDRLLTLLRSLSGSSQVALARCLGLLPMLDSLPGPQCQT